MKESLYELRDRSAAELKKWQSRKKDTIVRRMSREQWQVSEVHAKEILKRLETAATEEERRLIEKEITKNDDWDDVNNHVKVIPRIESKAEQENENYWKLQSTSPTCENRACLNCLYTWDDTQIEHNVITFEFCPQDCEEDCPTDGSHCNHKIAIYEKCPNCGAVHSVVALKMLLADLIKHKARQRYFEERIGWEKEKWVTYEEYFQEQEKDTQFYEGLIEDEVKKLGKFDELIKSGVTVLVTPPLLKRKSIQSVLELFQSSVKQVTSVLSVQSLLNVKLKLQKRRS